ncbi:hypothetical protein PsorP6_017146 [Peronosclerospora sorghi]|uniref:Uncharacterized protein n=1 Tax=Peronosclerospora sorghi TaxID=230839 RepID=A0ACC0WC93_9STRA|nr:hypothetical protein PsorP6_017146 [Peronosclerospora sorghi]
MDRTSVLSSSLEEDYAELALEPATVDSLMDGQCFLQHFSTQVDATRRKRPRESFMFDQDIHLLDAHFDMDTPSTEEWKYQKELLGKASPHAPSVSPTHFCRCGSFDDEDDVPAGQEAFDSNSASRKYLDRHIRNAIVVRVVRVETMEGQVTFLLKVSDAETQKRWEVRKTLQNMMRFYARIKDISLQDAPVKRALWGTFRGLRRFRLPKKLFRSRGSLNKQRQVLFDSFLRQTAALVAPVPLGPRRRQAILLLQDFVGVLRHCEVFDRPECTCFARRNNVNALQLVTKIFAAPEHEISRHCKSFVHALTQISLDDRHAYMSKRKARMLLNMISRKMGQLKKNMLKDDRLMDQLNGAHRTRSEPDYDKFLDEVKHAVCWFVQKQVLVPLEDHIHEALNTLSDWDDELALKSKIKMLQTKPQSFFGVPPHIVAGSGSDWESARRELRRVNEYALPLDKLKCLVRAAGAIFETCGSHSLSSGDITSSLTLVEEVNTVAQPPMTTDEFIPVHLFVLVMSNMSQLLVTCELLRTMCDPQDITGEMGYYLTTFEVALDLLVKHSEKELDKGSHVIVDGLAAQLSLELLRSLVKLVPTRSDWSCMTTTLRTSQPRGVLRKKVVRFLLLPAARNASCAFYLVPPPPPSVQFEEIAVSP